MAKRGVNIIHNLFNGKAWVYRHRIQFIWGGDFVQDVLFLTIFHQNWGYCFEAIWGHLDKTFFCYKLALNWRFTGYQNVFFSTSTQSPNLSPPRSFQRPIKSTFYYSLHFLCLFAKNSKFSLLLCKEKKCKEYPKYNNHCIFFGYGLGNWKFQLGIFELHLYYFPSIFHVNNS